MYPRRNCRPIPMAKAGPGARGAGRQYDNQAHLDPVEKEGLQHPQGDQLHRQQHPHTRGRPLGAQDQRGVHARRRYRSYYLGSGEKKLEAIEALVLKEANTTRIYTFMQLPSSKVLAITTSKTISRYVSFSTISEKIWTSPSRASLRLTMGHSRDSQHKKS